MLLLVLTLGDCSASEQMKYTMNNNTQSSSAPELIVSVHYVG